MSVPTNFLAVVFAALVNYILGAIWYGCCSGMHGRSSPAQGK